MVLEMANKELNANFQTDAITAKLEELNAIQVDRIINLLLPLNVAGIISKRTIQEAIPGVDPEEEVKRLADELKDVLQSIDFNKTGSEDEVEDGRAA